jgi:hypothetical protein
MSMRVPTRLSTSRLCASLLLAGAAIDAHAAGITGTYVAQSGNAAFVLQVVEAGSQLTGRYEEFVAQPGGKFDDRIFAFSAAVDGERFAGSIKDIGILGSTIPVSGEVHGDIFRLEGSTTFHVAMKRGDISEFQADVAGLRGASSAKQRTHAIERLADRITAFKDRLAKAIGRLPSLESRLAANTAKMASALDRERAIHGEGQRSVHRGQISVAIHQIGVDSSQARTAVDADQQDLHDSSTTLSTQASLARVACVAKVGPNQLPAPATCPRFIGANASLRKSVDEGKTAFEKFDAVWDRESATQDSLMKQADAAVN